MRISKTPLYYVWLGMKARCYNPNNSSYHNYGERGITVCDRWRNSFSTFLADMGPRPEGYTIERIDNDEGYFPENCRWATRREQARNSRINRLITHNGLVLPLAAWAEKLRISGDALASRLQRHPISLALSVPQFGRYLKPQCGCRAKSNAASGFKGAYKIGNRFQCQIGVNGTLRHVGMFATAELAAQAYNKAAIKYYGTKAKLNKIPNGT